MTTTGTYAFNPAASNLTLSAFSRIGIRRTELTTQHLSDAAVEANLLQATLAANQPNLWRSEVYPITLTAGTSNYSLPARMIAIQDVYLRVTPQGGSSSTAVDRMMYPMTLFEWDAQPNKSTQAPPTTYVVFKTLPPTITFWQTPDTSASYTAYVRLLSQSQDAALASGATLDMPYIYLDVYVAGLAHRLARIYARDQEAIRKQDYLEAWEAAARTDTQDSTSMFVSPDFSGFYR